MQRPKRTTPASDDEASEVAPLAPEVTPLAVEKDSSSALREGSATSSVFTKLICVIFFVAACFGLDEVRFLHVLLYASHANRPMVNLGIFFCTVVVLLGSYMEYYRASYLGEKLNYESAKTTTQAMLASMILAGVSFSFGLWPVWGWLTWPILFMWLWGFIVPLVVVLPNLLQRIVFGGMIAEGKKLIDAMEGVHRCQNAFWIVVQVSYVLLYVRNDEARFVRWLAENGACVDALAITHNLAGGRGVVATRDLAPDEEALAIPEKLMISEASVKLDKDLGPIFAQHRDLFSRDDPLLATFLTYHIHLQSDSFYFPYLSTLPTPETIQNWSLDELACLQDPQLTQVAEQRNLEIAHWYERITSRLFRLHPELFDEESFPQTSFCFAWQTVQARTFGRRLPWTALVPFADMLNHANYATVYTFDDHKFRWHSSVGYKAGDQVFNSYGRRPNHQLLLDYGFALPDNAWDYLDLDLSLDSKYASILSKFQRRAVMIKARLMPFKTRFRLGPDSTVDALIPYFRCHFLKEAHDDVDVTTPVADVGVERQAWAALLEFLQERAAAFPTTLADDVALLSQSTAPARLLIALTFRIGRKRLLARAQAATQAALDALTAPIETT
ncbi:hypothetical protein ACHHYP_02406 [Achlya hypogyna]|uniref:SET domain-containing protein n=1 Tax=Achlya hypogyna TaxID=1202772 RepID=A0A1V9ZS68_ACHHY|nr:hypothetical protein ACHHYP_02406 [Achlya hypogyna]